MKIKSFKDWWKSEKGEFYEAKLPLINVLLINKAWNYQQNRINKLEAKLSESQSQVKILKDFNREAEKVLEYYAYKYDIFDGYSEDFSEWNNSGGFKVDIAGDRARQFINSEAYKRYKQLEEE